MNVLRNRKVKKLADLPGYWIDLAQIWCRGYFWILNPKSTIKFLYDVILTSKWREGILPICRLQKMHMTSLWRHLLSIFLKMSIYLLLMIDYLHTKFGLIWIKETKVTEGGAESAPPQVGNVLNRPGEIKIGLIYRYIVIVAKSRWFAVRLTDFWVVSRACDDISWDLAKSSNQFLTLDFFCKFYSRKVNFSQFLKHYFQTFLGEHAPRPPRTGLKNFSRLCAARIFKPGISL